jgi:hypothetical protein
MAQPTGSPTAPISCTQLVTRFDRNGERSIALPLLRQVRSLIRRDMRAAGARGSMVWRLARTPSGITMTAIWHVRRERMIQIAQPARTDRQERRRRAVAAGVQNRRRVGGLTVPHAAAAERRAGNHVAA